MNRRHVVVPLDAKLQAVIPGAEVKQNRAAPSDKQWEVRVGLSVVAAAYSQREAVNRALDTNEIKRGMR